MSTPPPNTSSDQSAPFCAHCGAPNEAGLTQCPYCGQSLLAAAAWPPPPGGIPPLQAYAQPAAGGIERLIPTHNPSALTAYYLGIFSIIPCLAIPMGIAAVVLGLRGLKLFKSHPEVHGRTHAWVGIIAGGFFALINIAGLGLVAVLTLLRPATP